MESSVAVRDRGFGKTLRRDRWWLPPLGVALGLGFFGGYATWSVLQGGNYFADPYLSPLYSPCIAASCPAQIRLVGIDKSHIWADIAQYATEAQPICGCPQETYVSGKRSRCTFALLNTRACVGEVFMDELNCDAQGHIFEEMRAIRYTQGHAVAFECT